MTDNETYIINRLLDENERLHERIGQLTAHLVATEIVHQQQTEGHVDTATVIAKAYAGGETDED